MLQCQRLHEWLQAPNGLPFLFQIYLQCAFEKGILSSMSIPATTSIYMMLFKYKQYDKIIHLYEIMSKTDMKLDENVQLSIIRSYSNCQRLEDALAVMNKLIHSIEAQLQTAPNESTKSTLQTQLLKAYSLGQQKNGANIHARTVFIYSSSIISPEQQLRTRQ